MGNINNNKLSNKYHKLNEKWNKIDDLGILHSYINKYDYDESFLWMGPFDNVKIVPPLSKDILLNSVIKKNSWDHIKTELRSYELCRPIPKIFVYNDTEPYSLNSGDEYYSFKFNPIICFFKYNFRIDKLIEDSSNEDNVDNVTPISKLFIFFKAWVNEVNREDMKVFLEEHGGGSGGAGVNDYKERFYNQLWKEEYNIPSDDLVLFIKKLYWHETGSEKAGTVEADKEYEVYLAKNLDDIINYAILPDERELYFSLKSS